jgi:hypothetical protein
MIFIDAFHLPGLEEDDVLRWDVREYDGGRVRLRTPALKPAALERLLARMAAARDRALAPLPVAEIVRAIDAAAARFAEPSDPLRRLAEEALPPITGYSPAMIRLVLDRMAPDWSAGALWSLLRSELGDPALLDTFRPLPGAPGSRARAYGPRVAFHIFAGNVPGVAVTSLVRSLLVKAATLGKTASGEPLLAALFARALAELSPALGECLAVTYWPGGEAALEAVALGTADTVVVYGGPDVVQAIRERILPGRRLVEHGPRFSLALVARDALTAAEAPTTAAHLARATATFDQQGCVSPHAAYVERGGEVTPEAFAELLARAMAHVEEELPRGRLSAAEATAIQQLRGAAEFRGFAGGETRLFASAGTEYTVIYDAEPTFAASCLNRVLRVIPLDRLDDVASHIEPFGEFLQTVGVAAGEERRAELAARLGAAGASRITTLERIPWPPPTWHHDGQEPLRELLRWVDLEG